MGNKYDYDIGTVIAITLDSVLGNGSYERLLMVGYDVLKRTYALVSVGKRVPGSESSSHSKFRKRHLEVSACLAGKQNPQNSQRK